MTWYHTINYIYVRPKSDEQPAKSATQNQQTKTVMKKTKKPKMLRINGPVRKSVESWGMKVYRQYFPFPCCCCYCCLILQNSSPSLIHMITHREISNSWQTLRWVKGLRVVDNISPHIHQPHIQNFNRCILTNAMHLSRVLKTQSLVTCQPYSNCNYRVFSISS